MLDGESAELLSALSRHGYSLLQPERFGDANELLARMSLSKDTRVLEGFPVVLANAWRHSRETVDLESAERSLKSDEDRRRFRELTRVSFVLFDWYGIAKGESRPRWLGEDDLRECRERFAHGQTMELADGRSLDPGRLRNTFVSYVLRSESERRERADEKRKFDEELRLAHFLSLLLTPKQKQLVKKKMQGEKLTKTEREYYSRIVKKKLKAIADPDVHRFAQKALQ